MMKNIKGNSHLNQFYKDLESDVLQMDMYTAASLGDLSFFTKYDFRKLSSDLSIPNSSGWTPLMYACSRGHSLLTNYLLMSGAKRQTKTKSGVTPLMLAVSSGDLPTVESVFHFSGLKEADYRNWTPLFYAVYFSKEKCLNYLLRKGADVNVTDYQNETPLMVAIKLGREKIVELLLKNAKSLDVTSYKQESALMLARESNNPQIQEMVKKRYEFLKKPETIGERQTRVTPVGNIRTKITGHCSPTPLKHQLRSINVNMSKSLMYSPNRSPNEDTPKRELRVPMALKLPFQKKYWSPQLRPYNDVEQFLKSLGLEKYWPIFRDEEVDFETLMTLNEENLKELGIVLFGPRKKIYLALEQLRHRS